MKYNGDTLFENLKEVTAIMKKLLTLVLLVSLCLSGCALGNNVSEGYIKDMLKDFWPIENSDDWIMSILSNNIKVDKDGEETLEICGVMG